jgi:hypothetical protein
MLLKSGRIVPNWILQLAFVTFDQFGEDMGEVVEDLNTILQDKSNTTSHDALSQDDAFELYKKFNEMQDEFDDILLGFLEKNGLGPDEFDDDGEESDEEESDNMQAS